MTLPHISPVTQFRGILPPTGPAQGHPQALPPSKATPGGLILHALNPLRGELDLALAHDDRQAALQIAYGALGQVADALALYRGDRLCPSQVRIHALLVELEPLPLEPRTDGTLVERGTAVTVHYRNWAVEQAEATAWARSLSERFQTLWPGAWVLVQNAPHGAEPVGAGV